MELFKKRRTAVTVFVIVVIVFTLLGCHRSLGKACRRVEDAFFDCEPLVTYGAYTAPAEQLENAVKLANRLLSVTNTEALSAQYNALLTARQSLSDALDGRDISDIYDASSALLAAASDMNAQVEAGAVLPPSSDDYGAIVSDLFSALRVAAESPYNAYVDDFVRTNVRPFPTSLLRALSMTPLPEKYE